MRNETQWQSWVFTQQGHTQNPISSLSAASTRAQQVPGENCSACGKRVTRLFLKPFHRYFYENTDKKEWSIVNPICPQRTGRRCLRELKTILSGSCRREEDRDKHQSLSYKPMQIFLPLLPFPNRTVRETTNETKHKGTIWIKMERGYWYERQEGF